MILVTGGTGMLGAHLLLDLCQREDKVKAIKRPQASTLLTEKIFKWYSPIDTANALWQKIEWVEADLCDPISLELATEGISKLYHCAALVSFKQKEAEAMLSINSQGTANVVNACLLNKVSKLLYVSSIAALGRAENNGIVTENSPWQESKENSAYGISKHQAEMEVWRGIAEGLEAVVVNPAVIIGAGDWHKGSAELFRFVDKGLKYYTKGVNGYVCAKDVSSAMIQLMESNISGERFILNSENLSYQQLFEYIAHAIHKTSPSKELTPNLIHWGRYLYTLKDLISGKSPRISKQMAKNAISHYQYDNSKLLKKIDFSYTPMQEAIAAIGEIYLHDTTDFS